MIAAAERFLATPLAHLVDDRVGVLHAIREVRADFAAPAFFHVVAQLADTRAFSPQTAPGLVGAAAVDRTTAVARVVCAAVAAYCAALRPLEDDLRPACVAAAAPFPCVPPEDFALFAPAQHADSAFPWSRFDASTPVRWTPAADPLRGTTVHVPSDLVHFSSWSPGEIPIAPVTSIGLAAHWDATEAALAALGDAIEHDALAIAWQTGLALPQIRVETLSDANYDRVERFERTGAAVTLLDARLDLALPVFVAVLSSPRAGAPARVFASGSDPDPERAMARALDRLAHTHLACRSLARRQGGGAEDPAGVRTTEDHLRYWADPAHAALSEPFLGSQERLESDEIAGLPGGDRRSCLDDLLGRLAAEGLRGLLADVTTPEVRQLGLTALRAVVPGLQPLFAGHARRPLGGRRLREVPRRIGRTGIDPDTGGNPLPHPFPLREVEP